MNSRHLIAALSIVACIPHTFADTFPPDWGAGSPNEAAGPIHFSPAAWPAEPADPVDCTHACGDWTPYSRFQAGVADPRTQDPSNGGTSPQNYVNVASSCVDRSLPSIYYHLYRHPTDPTRDVLMFRWRVEQIAHTYATGPSAGNYRSADPWNSALWTVLFDIDGDGYRDLAAHLDGSSGSPSAPIDMIAGIWGNIPTQSIDYLNDPSIRLIAHNPTAFSAGGMLLNFHEGASAPDTVWPAGGSTDTWDYGTTRAKLVSTNACNEYFVDYQIPVRMLDASASGPNPALNGPKITRDTPISMLFCTANSLNNPFQKDCSLERAYIGDEGKPAPFGDYLSFNKTSAYSQPIVAKVTASAPATCPGSYQLAATVQDTLYVTAGGEIAPSVQSVRFLYWADSDGDGTMAGDAGSSWVDAASASLAAGSLNTWQASWDATNLPKGKYLIGVQAVDDRTLHDDGVPDAPVDNRTFSYLPGSTNATTGAQIYINPWTYDGATRSWSSGGAGDWISGQQAAFPAHATPTTPGNGENWFGNPDVTGVQTALIGVAINACGLAPTLTKSAAPTAATAGQDIAFTLTVSNPANNGGPVTLSQLVDPLPAGFVYNTGSTAGAFGAADPSISGSTLTWNGSVQIAPGTSATLSFSAKAPTTTGSYNNTASATTDFGAISSEPVQIGVGAARLSLSKSASSLSLNQGDTVTWTIHYANDSPIDARNVRIEDVLPAGITSASCSDGCSCVDNDTSGTCNAGDTMSWNVGTLAAGEGPRSLTIAAVLANPYPASAPVPLVNTATITSDDTAPASATAASHVAVPRPELVLAKTANKTLVDATAAAPANQVVFTLQYANTGAGDAQGVVLADPLPEGFLYVSATPTPGSAPAVGANGTVSWTLGTLAAGGSGSVTVTARPGNPFAGTQNPVTNTASLSASGLAPVQDSADVGVVQSGQLCSAFYFRDATGSVGFDGTRLLATTGAAPQGADIGGSTTITVPGGAGVYSSTVLSLYQDPASTANTNFAGNLTTSIWMDRGAGPGITIRGTVYDYDSVTGSRVQLGQGIQGFTGSASGLLTFTVPLSGTLQKNHRLLWTYEAASANSQSTALQFQYGGTVTNAISGSGTRLADSRAEFCVTPPANLIVDKRVSAASIAATGSGRTLTYTIDYANTSSATAASNAVIVDTLPAGVSLASASLNGTPIVPTGSNPYTFPLGTVAANGSGSLQIVANVDDDLSALSTLDNQATIASDQTAEQSARASTRVIGSSSSGAPLLTISKAVDDSSLIAGQLATYTLTVLNAGNGTASSVVVSDVLPVSGDFAYAGCSTATGSCSQSSGTVTWAVGALAAGASATASVTMQVAASPASGITTLDNQATVADADYCSGATPPAGCRSEVVTVSISTNPNLTLAKSVSDVVPAAGDTLTYTLTVTNTGSGAATDVVVSDPILGHMAFVGGITTSAGSGRFDAVDNRVVFDVGSLAGGAAATLSFQAAVDAVMPNGGTTLTNVASTRAGNSPLRTASATSTVTAGPLLSILKSGPASLPLPATRLVSVATAANTLFVADGSRLLVGDTLRVGGTLTRVTDVAGNAVAVATPVTAATGSDVLLGATFTLTWRNSGDADATHVLVSDPLPAGWRFVSATPTATAAPAVDANGTVSWDLGTVVAGSQGTLQVVAVATTAGSHSNTASIVDDSYCSGGTPPPACSSTLVTLVGGLAADKFTTTPLIAAGGTAQWTLVVRNGTAASVGSITVEDELPAGFSYVAASTRIDGSPAGDPVLVGGDAARPQWTITVPAGGSTTIRFDALADASIGAATYQNGIVVSAPGTGVLQFDPLQTTAEDVTVLAPGTGLVEGMVYRDLDANGNFDAAVDAPLTGVAVTIIDDTSTTYVAITDGAGRFSRVVSAGAAIVDVDDSTLPAGLMLTTGSDGSDPDTVQVPDGGSVRDDTGFVAASGPVGGIAGRVWLDADADQAQGGAEAGMLGVQVVLRHAASGSIAAIAYTDQLGDYAFPTVPAGDYLIDLLPPPGHYLTTANDPFAVTVAGGSNGGTDFGLKPGSTLSGRVFVDDGSGGGSAGDGLQNGGEGGTGAAAPRVVIVDGGGTVLAVAVVASDGRWSAGVAVGSGYAAILGTANPTVGSSFAAGATLSAGWQVTNENRSGSVDASGDGRLGGIDASGDVNGLNFGVEPMPTLLPDVFALIDAPPSVAPGERVTLAVTFGNQGDATAEGVTQSLQLPPGLTGVDCSSPVACSYDAATGLVTISGLPTVLVPQQSTSFLSSYMAPPTGPLPAQATISTTTAGETPTANNVANDSTTVSASVVDVAVHVVAPPTAAPGSRVAVDIAFANLGATAANAMTYGLTLPTGLSGVSCAGNGVSCSYNAGTGQLNIAGLPSALLAGQQTTFTLHYLAPASGTVVVSASTNASGDSVAANNTDSGATVVTGSPAVPDVYSLVSAPASGTAGGMLDAALTFGNLGPVPANPTYRLQLAGAAVSDVEIRYRGALCVWDAGSGVISGCELPATLDPGEHIELQLGLRLPASGSVVIASDVSAPGELHTANNPSSGTTAVAGAAVPDVFATVDAPATVAPGDTVRALVNFGNQGPATADGVTYRIELPAGLSAVTCSGAFCDYDPASGMATAIGLPDSLSPGMGVSLLVDFEAPAGLATSPGGGANPLSLTVTAIISTTTAGEAPTANNRASAPVSLGAGARADVTTWISAPASATPGATVTAIANFTNLGSANASAVGYGLSGLPAGATVEYNGVSCSFSAGVVSSCNLPTSLAQGQVVTLAVRYTAPASGTVTAVSNVSAGNDGDPSNNQDSAATTVAPSALVDVRATVSAPPTASNGSLVVVPLSYANGGPASAPVTRYGLTLSSLPASVEISHQGVACGWDGSTLTGCNLPAVLDAGQSLAVVMSYRAPAAGSITVTSTIATSATDTNAANDSRIASTSFTAGAPAGSISGTVWYDLDHDNVVDSGEPRRAGWIVELLAEAAGGDLLLTRVTTAADGGYLFSGLPTGTYTVRFLNPNGQTVTSGPMPVNGDTAGNGGLASVSRLSGIHVAAGAPVVNQSLPLDPSGVVYDSTTRTAISGAVVTLGGPAGFDAADVVGGSLSQTTGADGLYQFLLLPSSPPGTYTLTVSAAGHTFPSTAIPPSTAPGGFIGGDVSGVVGAPAVGQSTTYYLSFPLPTVDMINNNIPLDPPAAPPPPPPPGAVTPIPTLSEWGMLLLATLMLLVVAGQQRRHARR